MIEDFTDEEYKTITNIWSDDTSRNPGDIDTDLLIAMHERVTDAVQLSFEMNDVVSLQILLSIEEKVVSTLIERQGCSD